MAITRRPASPAVYIEGIAVWPSLNTPDTKFNADGKYTCKLKTEAGEAEALKAAANKAAEAFMAEKKAELQEQAKNGTTGKAKADAKKALEKLSLADPAITDEVDDEGEPTGMMLVNTGMPACFKSKKDKDANGDPKVIPMKPTICDAKGNVLKNPPLIWGGSRLCLKVELRPYFAPNTTTVGCSLRLGGVQILELVTKGGGGGGAPGFKAREGYSADSDEDTNEGTPSEDSAGDATPEPGAHEF